MTWGLEVLPGTGKLARAVGRVGGWILRGRLEGLGGERARGMGLIILRGRLEDFSVLGGEGGGNDPSRALVGGRGRIGMHPSRPLWDFEGGGLSLGWWTLPLGERVARVAFM